VHSSEISEKRILLDVPFYPDESLAGNQQILKQEGPMKTVLIVEDEAIVRDSLRDWLTDSGYAVKVAREGYEALRIIEKEDFDMVLLDLRLPGKDGLQVLREARLRKPDLKGVIITAYPTVGTALEAMKLGAVDFLTKPLDLTRLESLIQEKSVVAPLSAKPILVVDDEASIRESLKDWFLDAGYQVETAPDGEEALKLIGEKDFSLLILDLKLPGRDGIEVLREARRISPGLRGVIITAYPSVETAVEAMKLGVSEYLVKPLALSELEKIVAENTAPNRAEIIPRPKSRPAFLATFRVLDRAAEDPRFLAKLADSPEEALAEYTDLSKEEKEALIDGDIRRIESWIGRVNEKQATWLWCRLSQEKW
jgi:DNA-binding NtrC family response regulator